MKPMAFSMFQAGNGLLIKFSVDNMTTKTYLCCNAGKSVKKIAALALIGLAIVVVPVGFT